MRLELQHNVVLLTGALAAVVALAGCEQELGVTSTAFRCTSPSDCVQGFVCRDLGDGRQKICVEDRGVEADASGMDADAGAPASVVTVMIGDAVETPAAHKFVGAQPQQQFGWSLSGVGDFNDDDIDDFAVGAPMVESGRVYVFFGREDRGFSQRAQDADRNWGIIDANANRVGTSLAGGEDMFGTTNDDFIVGARGATLQDPGVAYLVAGSIEAAAEPFAEIVESRQIHGEQAGSLVGHSVAALGDISGDGSSDFLLGAPRYSDGTSDVGAAYVVLGESLTGWNTHLSDVGIRFAGTWSDKGAGQEVSGAGDFNGDGFRDFLIGVPQISKAYLFLGHDELVQEGHRTLDQADLTFEGTPRTSLGTSMAAIGDIDADGFDDILLGAKGDTGAVYLVRGRGEITERYFEMSDADVTIVAGSPGNPAPAKLSTGAALALAGHVDGDPVKDILIGVTGEGAVLPHSRGAVYLVYGATLLERLEEGTLYLDHADVRFLGEMPGDYLGQAVAGAGDVDGDGCDDILMSAQTHGFADGKSTQRGAAYLVFGPASGADEACD